MFRSAMVGLETGDVTVHVSLVKDTRWVELYWLSISRVMWSDMDADVPLSSLQSDIISLDLYANDVSSAES